MRPVICWEHFLTIVVWLITAMCSHRCDCDYLCLCVRVYWRIEHTHIMPIALCSLPFRAHAHVFNIICTHTHNTVLSLSLSDSLCVFSTSHVSKCVRSALILLTRSLEYDCVATARDISNEAFQRWSALSNNNMQTQYALSEYARAEYLQFVT